MCSKAIVTHTHKQTNTHTHKQTNTHTHTYTDSHNVGFRADILEIFLKKNYCRIATKSQILN